MIKFVYDNAVFTRLTALIWEHGDMRKIKQDDEWSNQRDGYKQAKSLSRIWKPLYSVVKLKVTHYYSLIAQEN